MPEPVTTTSQNSGAEATPAVITTPSGGGDTPSQQAAPSTETPTPAQPESSAPSSSDKPSTPPKVDTKSIHDNVKSILRGDQQSPTIKKVEEAKVEKSTSEGSGDEEVQTAPENVEESEGRTQPGKKVDSRKFDGLDEEEARLFRAMHNDSYAKLYPAYLEYKKQKETLAQKDQEITQLKASKSQEQAKVFYDHEEGYKLLPDYKRMEAEYDQASTEARIRQQQLAKVEAGEEWQEIAIDKEGNYVFTGPMLPPDSNAKAFLLSAITNLSVIQRDAMNKAVQFQKGYKERYTSAASAIEQVLMQHAPEFKDQSYAGWEVAKKLISAVPEFANHPMTKVAGVLFAKLHQWQEQAKVEAKAKEVKKVIATDKRNGGPSVGGTQVANKPIESPRFDMNAFRRRIETGV